MVEVIIIMGMLRFCSVGKHRQINVMKSATIRRKM